MGNVTNELGKTGNEKTKQTWLVTNDNENVRRTEFHMHSHSGEGQCEHHQCLGRDSSERDKTHNCCYEQQVIP